MKPTFGCLLLFFSFCQLQAAETDELYSSLSCRTGGVGVLSDYRHAVNLMRLGRKLTETEELGVLNALHTAVDNECSNAALALLSTYAPIQLPPREEALRVDEIFRLFQKALVLDEGWYEYGMFLLATDTRYHSVEGAVKALETAAERAASKPWFFWCVHIRKAMTESIRMRRALTTGASIVKIFAPIIKHKIRAEILSELKKRRRESAE